MSYIFYYICVSINSLLIIFLFTISYINILLINEQKINIPIIKSENSNKFLYPDNKEKNKYNFSVLKSHDDISKYSLDNTQSFKTKDKLSSLDSKLLNDKIYKKNAEKKFRVQFGVFKNKDNAEKKKKNVVSKLNDELLKYPLTVNSFERDGKKLYNVSTKFIKKNRAIELCNSLKIQKINCIIKIEDK